MILSLILSIIIATILIQIPNLIGVSQQQELNWVESFKISFYSLPLIYIATACYTFFYGKGSLYYSYPSLSIMAKILTIFTAIIIQVYFLKNRDTNIVEVLGVIFAIIGTTIIIYNKEIIKILNIG